VDKKYQSIKRGRKVIARDKIHQNAIGIHQSATVNWIIKTGTFFVLI
jgi:hypothetical protein